MAFVVKNSSSFSGEAKIDKQWVSIPSGRFVTSDTRPTLLSANLVVFSVSDGAKDKKGDKRKGDKGLDSNGANTSNELVLDSSLSGESSNSLALE